MSFEAGMRYARAVLHYLKEGPRTWTEIGTFSARSKDIGTAARGHGVLRHLRKIGHVEKQGEYHRAPYAITEKGLKFLKGLSNNPFVSRSNGLMRVQSVKKDSRKQKEKKKE